MRLLTCALVVLFTAACTEPVRNPPSPGDTIAVPPFEWRVRSRAELEAIYRDSGMALAQNERLHGFVGKDGDTWVVYTTPPMTVDDQATCTLGHEVLHIAIGDFHK